MLLVSELQREAETPGERVPSVCCAVSVTQWCRVSSKRTPALPQRPSPTPSPPTVPADSAPGSDADHLLNDRSVSFSSVYESIPRSPSSPSLLSVLPGNRWTRACKQKPNRLSNWLLMSFGRVRSRQVLRLAAERNGTQTNRHTSKQRQPPAFLTSARYFTLTDGC